MTRFDDELDDLEPQATVGQALRDGQARVMALTALLVQRQFFTDQEFLRALADANRRLDEESTRRIDAREATKAELLVAREQQLRDSTWAYLQTVTPQATVSVFRCPTEDLMGQQNTLFVRIVSPIFTGLNVQARIRAVPSILRFTQQTRESVWPLLLTPAEATHSAANLQFELLRERSQPSAKPDTDP